MRLSRGVTLRGQVIGPDGTPIVKAFAFGRSYVPRLNAFPLDVFNGSAPEIPVRDGRFEIPGCDPEKSPVPLTGSMAVSSLPRPGKPSVLATLCQRSKPAHEAAYRHAHLPG